MKQLVGTEHQLVHQMVPRCRKGSGLGEPTIWSIRRCVSGHYAFAPRLLSVSCTRRAVWSVATKV